MTTLSSNCSGNSLVSQISFRYLPLQNPEERQVVAILLSLSWPTERMIHTASICNNIYFMTLNHGNLAVVAWTIIALIAIHLYLHRSRRRTPKLRGPPRGSWLFGATQALFESSDPGIVYGNWEKKHGSVYEIPSSMGSRILVLADPKAIAHLFAKDTSTYYKPQWIKTFIRRVFGAEMSVLEGESHKRERRLMASALSNAAVRKMTPAFLDSAYKVTTAWNLSLHSNSKVDSTNSITVDVAKWVNYIALDSVGNGCFAHDFGSPNDDHHPVIEAFESVGATKPSLALKTMLLLGPHFPSFATRIPNETTNALKALCKTMKENAEQMLTKARKDKVMNGADRTVLGAFVKGEDADPNVQMASRVGLIFSAYETTAITLTWAFIELARHPKIQETLRAELRKNMSRDTTTYDLMVSLPYLDAFTCELLRFRPVTLEVSRVANEDDTIPLSQPITTASGAVIDTLLVSKGIYIRIPIVGVNRSEALWGPDASTFDPSRWLEPESTEPTDSNQTSTTPTRKEEIRGYRHLLTFVDGPRMCPGRHFAVTEFKAVLSVLLRNFSFELPDGPDTKIEILNSAGVRPKVAGEEGLRVPLIIKKVEVE